MGMSWDDYDLLMAELAWIKSHHLLLPQTIGFLEKFKVQVEKERPRPPKQTKDAICKTFD